MAKLLLILNDPPYGTERSYNGLRLALGLDARGIAEADLIEGARRSSMAELTEWTLWADKILSF